MDRPNTITAQLVDAALATMRQRGRRAAADELSAAGVPFRVIVRVLDGRWRRPQEQASKQGSLI